MCVEFVRAVVSLLIILCSVSCLLCVEFARAVVSLLIILELFVRACVSLFMVRVVVARGVRVVGSLLVFRGLVAYGVLPLFMFKLFVFCSLFLFKYNVCPLLVGKFCLLFLFKFWPLLLL